MITKIIAAISLGLAIMCTMFAIGGMIAFFISAYSIVTDRRKGTANMKSSIRYIHFAALFWALFIYFI